MQKSQPGLIKAQVQASGPKQMVFVFFNNNGVKYTNYLLRHTIVNAIYILGPLTMFLKHFKKIKPEMLCRYCGFNLHTAGCGVGVYGQPLYSLVLVPSDFTLFPKAVLAGTLNARDSLKKT